MRPRPTSYPRFNGTFAVVGDFDTVFDAMFGPQQHDAHMKDWRWIAFAYGTVANWARGYEERQARRAPQGSVTMLEAAE